MNINGDRLDDYGRRIDESGKLLMGNNGKEKPRKKNIMEKTGLFAPPRRMKCRCGHTATKRRCPNPRCAAVLPISIGRLPNLHIAIIGAKGTGKSNYIAMLIMRIQQMYRDFGWTLQYLDDRTNIRYKNDFMGPIKNRVPVPTSQSASVNPETSKPLLYSLNFTNGFFKRRIMLAFFDTAGEDLNKDVDSMRVVNKYISLASGIICLLDPMQIEKVRASLEPRLGKNALPEQGKDTSIIINQVGRMIQEEYVALNKSGADAKAIKIPLAVAFSKIDAVSDEGNPDPTLLPSDCQIFRDTRHKGIFNRAEFNTVNGLMKGWLDEVDPEHEIPNQSKMFKDVAYFGFSALGCNPMSTNGRLPHDPLPKRVEDPFLWILHKNGLIKMQ